MQIHGSTALVTGANGGIGTLFVEQLPELLKEREAEQLQPDPVIVEEPVEVQPEASTQTEPEPIQTEPTPTKATEETAPEVEPPSATELPPEQTAKSNQGDEPSAIENPEVTPQEALSQPKGEVAQPQQESTAQQQEAPQPKPKPQAKPEDWPKYASALGRGHVIQARIKKVIAAYQQGTALDMKASISMGKDFREFTQELNSIRDWYRAAQQLNRGDEHLGKIMKVGNNFKQGKPISDRAHTIRTQDINQATYNRFSTELNRDNPKKFLVRLAANAAKAGLSNRRIMGALSMDPEVQSMHYQNGEQASLKYSRSIMLEGLKLKKREQPKVIASQQSQEISRNQGLGR